MDEMTVENCFVIMAIGEQKYLNFDISQEELKKDMMI